MADRRYTSDWVSRTSFVAIVLVAVSLLLWASLTLWRSWHPAPAARFVPRPVSLQVIEGQQKLENPCFALLVPADFTVQLRASDCRINVYARDRKYAYVAVDSYFGTHDEASVLAVWKQRWLTLGAELVSQEKVDWSGKPALKLIERYPQNGEQFTTYLISLPRPLGVDSSAAITAIELRAWSTSSADQALVDSFVTTANWQWRF